MGHCAAWQEEMQSQPKGLIVFSSTADGQANTHTHTQKRCDCTGTHTLYCIHTSITECVYSQCVTTACVYSECVTHTRVNCGCKGQQK